VQRRQADFTADASHELRTPISVIEAEVSLALDRPRDPEAYRAALVRVGEENQRLRGIVEDLLWLARADSAPETAGMTEQVDVTEVSEECANRFAALAATSGVTLNTHRRGTGSTLMLGRHDLVDRLAGVLIDNACKFAGAGGRVDVTVASAGNRVVFRVEDSGPGIPEDEREAVFDRFHRATGSVTGTGLGLAIADSVVRATQGEWHIGVADLGGARIEVSWRAVPTRKPRQEPAAEHDLRETLA
jgi:two-component system sensor histidine kinase TctE